MKTYNDIIVFFSDPFKGYNRTALLAKVTIGIILFFLFSTMMFFAVVSNKKREFALKESMSKVDFPYKKTDQFVDVNYKFKDNKGFLYSIKSDFINRTDKDDFVLKKVKGEVFTTNNNIFITSNSLKIKKNLKEFFFPEDVFFDREGSYHIRSKEVFIKRKDSLVYGNSPIEVHLVDIEVKAGSFIYKDYDEYILFDNKVKVLITLKKKS